MRHASLYASLFLSLTLVVFSSSCGSDDPSSSDDDTIIPPETKEGTIVAGDSHSCTLIDTGAVKCWGSNKFGQLGDGGVDVEQDGIDQNVPVDVVGLSSGVIAISAGASHSCALLDTGAVKCWGLDRSGQLGDGGDNIDQITPVDVYGLSSGVMAISAGGSHSCALMESGAVKCWGDNDDDQLGDGSGADQGTPVDVTGLSSGVIAISAGGYHSCALLDTGAMKCWGDASYSQLGNEGAAMTHSSPVDVDGLSSGVIAIEAGYLHTCALLDTGAMKCWGNDDSGQLGDGGTHLNQATPVDVSGLSSGVIAMTAGFRHSCALLDTGAVKCWGWDEFGQLGDVDTQTTQGSPVDVLGLSSGVISIAVGDSHSCAFLDTGAIKCWGSDELGQLGGGIAHNDHSRAADVAGLSSGVGAIALGAYHSCALLDTGAMKCWGWDISGQLGDDAVHANQSVAVDVAGLSSGVDAIALGNTHSCALLNSGAVKCWGENGSGQLGDGSTNADQSVAIDVDGLPSGVTAIVAGAIHSCALLSAGTVKCWGANGDGQLGNGAANTDEVTPVDVSGLSDVAAIVAGYHHNCALLNSGAVKCWGDNYSGQLGDGGTNPLESTPVDVSGLANVIAITAGGSHSCALLDTGAVKCWGSDYYGQLGDSGYNTDSTTPVDVVGLSGTVTAITAGFVHTCALLDTGAMKCWGGNDYGQLGNGEVLLEETSPVNVAGIASGVTAIAAGEHHSCALFNTGAMKCWGNDNYGQLGDNPCRDYSCDVPVDVVGLP